MELNVEEVRPLLPRRVSSKQEPILEGLVDGASVFLTGRYPAQRLTAAKAFVLVTVAAAIGRRLTRPDAFMVRENAGPFGGGWSEAGAKASLFHPHELKELDMILGGGSRTYRTPAPDEQRFSNLYRCDEFEADHGEIELPAPGGWYA